MKSRLSSTVWTLVVVNGLALLVVIGLAFHAGREAGGDKSILDFASLPSGASGAMILAVLLSLVVGGFLAWRLGSSVGARARVPCGHTVPGICPLHDPPPAPNAQQRTPQPPRPPG